MTLLSVAPQRCLSNFAAHCCVGVVRSPCVGSALGEPLWSCRILLTECGWSASSFQHSKIVCSQEMILLKCRGIPFVEFATFQLLEGALVHVVARMYKKPRFVPIHGTYVEDTELLVSEQFGSLVVLKAL